MSWEPSFETAFHPKVVAMVGVSADSKHGDPWGPPRGYSIMSSYEQLGFQGHIYMVHPKAKEILGRKAYPSISSIPEPVDLVVVSVPAEALPGVLEDCITANAKNVHVFTAGFEETGEAELEELGQRVRQIALRGGLRIIGPNCMGLYVPESRIGPFDELSKESGVVSLISQSGGHCNWFCHYAPNYGIRLSKAISFGNAYVMDSTDFLEYLAVDPETKIICMYLEGVKDGAKLLKQVRSINRVKPVILWKAGLTESGSRAAASHTGSLAGQEAIWRAFFTQTGAIQVSSLEEMAEITMTFLHVKPPPGKRVAVLGLGGGSSVASADACNQEGMEVPALTQNTQSKLRKFFRLAGTSVKNPLDTGRSFSSLPLLKEVMELVITDSEVDMLIVKPHLDVAHWAGPDHVDQVVNHLSNFCSNNSCGKPTVIVFDSLSNAPWERELRAKLEIELPDKGVAVYSSLAKASRALFKLSEYHRFQKKLAAEKQ
ncbi:CoA-binding protein [Chloroflexota bacterium]